MRTKVLAVSGILLLVLAVLVTCAASSKTQIPGNVSGFRELLSILKSMQTDIYADLDATRAYVDSNFVQWGEYGFVESDTILDCHVLQKIIYLDHKYESADDWGLGYAPYTASLDGDDAIFNLYILSDSSFLVQVWRDDCGDGITFSWLSVGLRKLGAD